MTEERPTTAEPVPACPTPEDFARRQAAGERVTDLLRQSALFTDFVLSEGHPLGQE